MPVGSRRFDAHTIKQSCSWACSPENVITVSLHHATVKILSTCSPKLTISGLGHAVVEDGNIELTDLLNSKNASGIWETGTLSVELSDLMPSNSNGAQDFHFTFTVRNPNYPVPAPPTISMVASIDPITKCLYDKTGQIFTGVMTSPSVCADQWDFAGGSEYESSTSTSDSLNADKSAGRKEVTTTKTHAKDGNQLNETCLGCCHKEVCTSTTIGKSPALVSFQ